jgi:class 3 adenylate cyclase
MGKRKLKLFVPLYLLFFLSVWAANMLSGFIEHYSLIPFEDVAVILRENADRLGPMFEAMRAEEGSEASRRGEEIGRELEAQIGQSVHSSIEEVYPWFRLRNTWLTWLPLLLWYLWPVYKYQWRANQAGPPLDPDALTVRRILNLPVFLLVLPLLGSGLKLIIEVIALRGFTGGFDPAALGVFFASFFLFNSVAAYVNTWFTSKYVNNGVAAAIFTGPVLHDLKSAKSPDLTSRIFVMILTVGIIPVILNLYVPIAFNLRWFSSMFESATPDFMALAASVAPLFVLVVLNLYFLVAQVVGILSFRKNIQLPVNRLIDRMRDVARGNFQTRASVLSSDEIGQLKGHFNQMVEGLEEREKIRDTFGKFVSMEIAKKLIDEGGVDLAGEEISTTVMFTDIRNFTAFSEKRSPREVIDFLNDYFTSLVGPITAHRGVVNKFIGDSVMAVFSPVFGLEDHAQAALRAALEIRAALEEFNARGNYEPIRHGIGIHTGLLVAGNVGAEERKEYTVIGDTVNVASRLESQSKIENTDILVSESVHSELGDMAAAFGLQALEPVEIRGKTEAMKIYAVRGPGG